MVFFRTEMCTSKIRSSRLKQVRPKNRDLFIKHLFYIIPGISKINWKHAKQCRKIEAKRHKANPLCQFKGHGFKGKIAIAIDTS